MSPLRFPSFKRRFATHFPERPGTGPPPSAASAARAGARDDRDDAVAAGGERRGEGGPDGAGADERETWCAWWHGRESCQWAMAAET